MSAVALLVAGLYALLELALASLLAAWVGWGWVIVAMAALAVLGIAVMRRAGLSAARTLQQGTAGGTAVPSTGTRAAIGDASLRFVAGALIAVPGFATSILGLLMLVRPLRRVLGAATVGWVVGRLRRRGVSVVTRRGDVVEGEVVPDDPPGRPDHRALGG